MYNVKVRVTQLMERHMQLISLFLPEQAVQCLSEVNFYLTRLTCRNVKISNNGNLLCISL